MTIQVHVENIFPTPLYISSVNVDGVDVSDVEYTSTGPANYVDLSSNDRILDSNKYSFLKEQIDMHMMHFYYNILGYAESTRPEMTSSWIVKSLPGQQTNLHLHGNSIFSGVVYLSAPKNSGDIVFQLHGVDDRRIMPYLEPEIKNENPYNKRVYPITPTKGLLLLFLSSLMHRVDANCSDSERISLAFNYFLKGKFTNFTGKLELK